jgi:hypothetical protein
MAASLKKKPVTEYDLPANIGEIDITAPFDAHAFYATLRSAGANPFVWRHKEQGVMYCLHGHRPGFFHGPSEIHKRRFYEACAWAGAQDRDQCIRNSFLKAIVATKPDGDFMHYLGC